MKKGKNFREKFIEGLHGVYLVKNLEDPKRIAVEYVNEKDFATTLGRTTGIFVLPLGSYAAIPGFLLWGGIRGYELVAGKIIPIVRNGMNNARNGIRNEKGLDDEI